MSGLVTRKRPRKDEESGSSTKKTATVSENVSDSDVICPICFNVYDGVQVTSCGHSFCHDCIKRSLSQSPECPVCKTDLRNQSGFVTSSYVANFSLNNLVVKVKSHKSQLKSNPPELADVIDQVDNLDTSALAALSKHIEKRLSHKNEEEINIEETIYGEFLAESLERHEKELAKIKERIAVLHKCSAAGRKDRSDVKFSEQGQNRFLLRRQQLHCSFDDMEECFFALAGASTTDLVQCVPDSVTEPEKSTDTSLATDNTSLATDNTSLAMDNTSSSTASALSLSSSSGCSSSAFCDALKSVTQYSSFQELATLHYGDGPIGSSSIVSSIEFDKDGDYFAVGGVTKKIKIYDYSSVTANQHTFANIIHYPVKEIPCVAKISSVAYNPYVKQQLAASDYDGTLSIWDSHHLQCIHSYREHEKRVWSVSYNYYDNSLLATGGDDCTLKLWHLTKDQSILSQPTRANVCSVRFQPGNKYCLAYGSADHMIRLVDIRKFTEPIVTFKGHKKAVSYVQFLSETELVSASTDSELKLWCTASGTCLRTYRGHVNDKNFVGLSVNNGYITCGSENNSFYVYQKYVSKPVLKYKFNIPRNILPGVPDQRNDEGSDFVSAVCSRKNSGCIVSANSQGFIKVLQMI